MDGLDRELEQRGLRFVRYADDFIIFVGSKRAAKRVMESVSQVIVLLPRSAGSPWYVIRMPGGVGGAVSDGRPYPDMLLYFKHISQ